MRGLVGICVVSAIGCALAGCADPNTKPIGVPFGTSTGTMVMGPNLRVVMEREREVSNRPPLATVCTEPNPDVAIAFGRSLAAEANYSRPEGATVSGNVNIATTETATALAGRTAGVLALRDGLYAACQSYVNGVLGHDAYAVILSQYGNLLVALAGTGTAGNPVAYTAQDAAIGAMLVACVSEHDPTRIRARKPNGDYDHNSLLTKARCTVLMNKITNGQLLAPVKKATAPAKKNAEVKVGAGEKVTTVSKTVTEKSGPPIAAK